MSTDDKIAAAAAAALAGTSTNYDGLVGHAYHYNLPSQYMDPNDGIPLVTKYAHRKALKVVEIAYSLQLTEDMFRVQDNTSSMDLDGDDNDDDDANEDNEDGKEGTLESILLKCTRLSSLMSTLDNLKYNGISQQDHAQIMIHLLHLISATVVYEKKDGSGDATGEPKLNYDNVGFLYNVEEKRIVYQKTNGGVEEVRVGENVNETKSEAYLKESFALPSPAREALLSVIVSMLTKEKLLRSVSNTSFRVDADVDAETNMETNEEVVGKTKNDALLLVVHWKAMLRMLLRTAPYLDEHKCGLTQVDSLARQSTILKRTVLAIRYLRRFYDQGYESIKDNIISDKAAREVWDMVKGDLLNETHSNACFRSMILLYLFQPSRCSRSFYKEMLPLWMESWTTIDRCPDADFLWLTILCRARKYVHAEDYDWGLVRKRLLTLCAYWLQIPVGGKSSDKSFPNASQAKSRGMPSRLKSFLGNGSSYQEGVDFVSKLSKLLVFCIGKNDVKPMQQAVSSGGEVKATNGTNGAEDSAMEETSDGTEDLLRFFAFVGPYFHPSNTGAWTFPLGVLLHYFSFEFCRRMARNTSHRAITAKYPQLAAKIMEVEPFKQTSAILDSEVVLILDSILPLCQQALYSKSPRVSRGGEQALLYLSQMDHKICPMFLDFAMRALDISSVALSHQAPAALSALSRLVSPSLKRNPAFFLERLPDILNLSLAGIDSNDQTKTVRTLILYRTITSWIPVGKSTGSNWCDGDKTCPGTFRFGKELTDAVNSNCESEDYWNALRNLPSNSLLHQAEMSCSMDKEDEQARLSNLMEETAYAMGDWSIAFLERLYDLFRAAGVQEKRGKSHGVASRHSSADASEAKHFMSLLKQCLFQVFSSMDDKNFELALRCVENFLISETLPMAVKYASILCEAVCAARMHQDNGNHSPGLISLLPQLAKDLRNKSTGTILYRLRCIGGAVRQAGKDVAKYKKELFAVLEFALGDNDDKHIFKAGCKLLRHLLSSQSESYIILNDSCPRFSEEHSLGKSAHLDGDKILWHIPDGQQLNLVAEILSYFIFDRLRSLSLAKAGSESIDLSEWRRCLKLVRYTLRGTSGLLQEIDGMIDNVRENIDEFDPTEIAISALSESAPQKCREVLSKTRGSLAILLSLFLSIIANGGETVETDNSEDGNVKKAIETRSIESLIATDVKICKEVSLISIYLSTRRGASVHSQDERSLWKVQKSIASDRMLSSARKEIMTVLLKAGLSLATSTTLYNDGEEGGKSLSRRMVTTRVNIFHHQLQRNSSYEVPRRLRRRNRNMAKAEKGAFSCGSTFSREINVDNLYSFINNAFDSQHLLEHSPDAISNLSAYEGMLDGGFALACHSSNQARSKGFRLVEHLMTRFGWFAAKRVKILISSMSLTDEKTNPHYGLISCKELSSMDTPPHRKRLAEVLKGISNLLSLRRVMKEVIPSEIHRQSLIKILCNSQKVISILPPEEMQKMILYFHSVFASFRSRFYSFPRLTKRDEELREQSLLLLISAVGDEDIAIDEVGEGNSAHWRDRLVAAWFLLTFIDKSGAQISDNAIRSIWDTCINIIQQEDGQPIQKVTLGLIGKLANLTIENGLDGDYSDLQKKMRDESFCIDLCNALVSNHKEDKSIGGGHRAQWSVGVESILKDSLSNLSPRIIFPFKRAGRSSLNFLTQHGQLLSALFQIVGRDCAIDSAKHFLSYAHELASSLPSEDQRNQVDTAAEIFSGVAQCLLNSSAEDDVQIVWTSTLLPFFEKALEKSPTSALATYSDSLRFIVRDLSPKQLLPLTEFVMNKIEKTLWQFDGYQSANGTASDGFAEQSKWVVMMCVVLIEIDTEIETMNPYVWYHSSVTVSSPPLVKIDVEATPPILHFWTMLSSRLLPRLLHAIGHPYQKCREQVAWCLFRVYNCYKKLSQQIKILPIQEEIKDQITNPGDLIFQKLSPLSSSTGTATKEAQHSLITTRLFLFYCLHYGDNKNEYAEFILPLLPMAFEAIKPEVEGEGEVDADVRMLQAQVVKGFRYTIAEVGASCFVTYNNSNDISQLLKNLDTVSLHDVWQVRHAAAHFLRCFQGCHKFLFTSYQTKKTTRIVAKLLADDRKEVSAAAMSALTGILASSPSQDVGHMVHKYIKKANNSVIKKKRSKVDKQALEGEALEKEFKRAVKQQTSVYFLCASVLARPYDTPSYAPKALAALSRHSYESSAPFTVREAVKLCCREFKRTHMTDNWELHKEQFTREQLEALDDVVSTPHYYA
uniref:Uncharacterized protein n=1 Tax=Chaetoceros debilis TaxID=122233 RepID=A0A7S3V8U0_9STRA